MVLKDFAISGGWIQMNWNMTSTPKWNQLINGVRKMNQYYDSLMVLAGSRGGNDGRKVDINGAIQEAPMLVVQGQSKYLNGPLMITFENGSEVAAVAFPSSLGTMDYEALTKYFGPFLDTFELMMYTK